MQTIPFSRFVPTAQQTKLYWLEKSANYQKRAAEASRLARHCVSHGLLSDATRWQQRSDKLYNEARTWLYGAMAITDTPYV